MKNDIMVLVKYICNGEEITEKMTMFSLWALNKMAKIQPISVYRIYDNGEIFDYNIAYLYTVD